MNSAKIKGISFVTPHKVLSNKDLVKEFPEWSIDKIANKVGVNKRHITNEDEYASDLAIKAAKKMFDEYNIDKKEIDLLILCTQSPDYALPTTACIIQDKLGLPTSCGAFDFNQGCSGYIYGLSIAKGFISSSIAKNILLLTAETYSKYLGAEDKSNRTIFGDAASATLISTEGFAEIRDFVLGSDGSGAENLIVKNSGARKTKEESNKLFMNGAEIFNFTLKNVPKMVEETLIKNKIDKDSIDYFVLHQANSFMLNHLRKKMKIVDEKFYNSMEEVGNTVSSTIPIALYEAIKRGRIKKDYKLLIAGFGVGYSWGATVLTFENLY